MYFLAEVYSTNIMYRIGVKNDRNNCESLEDRVTRNFEIQN